MCTYVCMCVFVGLLCASVHHSSMHILTCTNMGTPMQVTQAQSDIQARVCLCPFLCVHAQGLHECAHVCTCGLFMAGMSRCVCAGSRVSKGLWLWTLVDAGRGLTWPLMGFSAGSSGRDPTGRLLSPWPGPPRDLV